MKKEEEEGHVKGEAIGLSSWEGGFWVLNEWSESELRICGGRKFESVVVSVGVMVEEVCKVFGGEIIEDFMCMWSEFGAVLAACEGVEGWVWCVLMAEACKKNATSINYRFL